MNQFDSKQTISENGKRKKPSVFTFILGQRPVSVTEKDSDEKGKLQDIIYRETPN